MKVMLQLVPLLLLLLLGMGGVAGDQSPWRVQSDHPPSHPMQHHQQQQQHQQHQQQHQPSPAALTRETVEKIDAHGKRRTWQRYTHAAFPSVAVRLKENVTLCEPEVQQRVGYLDVGEDKHFFFWLSESRSKPATDPLVLWLNGGWVGGGVGCIS